MAQNQIKTTKAKTKTYFDFHYLIASNTDFS